MNIEIWKLINCNVDACFKKIELKYFDDEKHKMINWIKFFFCCHVCDSDFCFFIEASHVLNQNAERDSAKRPWYDKKIAEWRENKIRNLFENSKMQYVFSFVMSNEIMKILTIWTEYIHDEKSMRKWIENEWSNIKFHWFELLNIVKKKQNMKSSRDEMFEIWNRIRDIKTKKIVLPEINFDKMKMKKRKKKWLKKKNIDNQKKNKQKK